MAIEKMSMINVVGPISQVDLVAKEVVLTGSIDVVNALNEMKKNNFTLDVREENIETLVDLSKVQPISLKEENHEINKKIEFLQRFYQQDLVSKENHIQGDNVSGECFKEVDELFEKFKESHDKIQQAQDRLHQLEKYYENVKHIRNLEVDLKKLTHMHYFHYLIGILTKENAKKVKKNYENIPAILLPIEKEKKREVYVAVFPKDLQVETERILRSLNFQALDIPEEFSGSPLQVIEDLQVKINQQKAYLKGLMGQIHVFKEENREIIQRCYSALKLEQKINQLKKEMVITQHYFYFSGWIPNGQRKQFEKRLEKLENVLVYYKEKEEINSTFVPPTKLQNNWFFKPFEFLVKMYGIPSYGELDPTPFLGLTYMLFFGAMFGDVGQGLVLFLGGWYLSKKKSKDFGPLLTRVGMSSILFGFMYGSVFGFEHIIPALLIIPFENINLILVSAVVLGVFLLFISYGYSIINGLMQGDYKEAIFGRNGIVGALFYAVILLLLVDSFLHLNWLPLGIGVVFLLVLMGLMVVREPLSNLLLKKRPLYHESASGYYIESGFEILETLLSMISNTLSFIRVGAFALTHVGLFMAFQVIAGILGSLTGSIIVLIIGNIVIIALEGLIVSIQALRLEYYELFSKYYRGEGREYQPFAIPRS